MKKRNKLGRNKKHEIFRLENGVPMNTDDIFMFTIEGGAAGGVVWKRS